jgi:acid phosphatase class B
MTELVSLYKMAMNQIVSFDFDGTIRLKDDVLNTTIVTKIMEEKTSGKVYLVTARADTKDNVDFVMKFLKDNEIFSLFDGFYFVGDFKYKKLQELGVVRHYDNDNTEVMLAKEVGIDAIKI